VSIRRLTVKQRIQLHLFDFQRLAEAYEAPVDVTQDGIAQAVGIQVHHVVQYVRPLVSEGLVEARTSHIERRTRRRKVYFLTPKGRAVASALRSELQKETKVPLRRVDGRIEPVSMVEILQEHRRGSRLVELLRELEGLGAIAEAAEGVPHALVDHSQEAPAVRRFYGRTKDLEAILHAVDSRTIVVVTGMAGIGKTALGAKACEALRGKRPLFWRQVRPWDTALDLAFRLAAFLRALGRTELYGSLVGSGARLAEVEERLAKDLAGTRSLIVLDDVHSASADVEQFLTMMRHSLARADGVSALLLSRTVPTFYSRREVEVDGTVEEVVLRGLDRDSSVALLEAAGLQDPLVGGLAEACEGVPLFLVLLANAKGLGRPGELRKTLDAYVSEEIERGLDDAERGCLEAASFCQVPVPTDVLRIEPGVRSKTLVALERKGLLTPVGPDRFVVHETLRDYFLRGLSAPRREALVDAVVPRLLDAARDAERAGRLPEAIAYVGNAAFVDVDRARRLLCLGKLADLRRYVGDIPGAIDAHRTALRHVEDPPDRARLLEKVAACLHIEGHLEEAERTIEEGLGLLGSRPSLEAAWLSLRKAEIALTRDDYDGAFAVVEPLVGSMAGLPRDPKLWGALANLRGSIHLDDPKRVDYALAYADFREALEAWEAAGELRGVSRASNNLGLAALHLGRPDEALAAFGRSADVAEAIGDLPGQLKALFVKAWYLSESVGDYEAADRLYRETYRLAKVTHQREKLLAHHLHFASLYWREGRYQEARESLEYYLIAARDMISEEDLVEHLAFLCRLCVAGGDVPAAEGYVAKVQAIDRRLSSSVTTYHAAWAEGTLLAAKGNEKRAADAFQRAFDHLTVGHEGEFLLEFGRFCARRGNVVRARELLVRAREVFTTYSMGPMVRATEDALRNVESQG
jgi:tetratricopeptide (TPR) repeat protein/DNA-binding MarR family transcriptional regulator